MGHGREVWWRRRDGSEIPIYVNLTPVRTDDGLFVIGSHHRRGWKEATLIGIAASIGTTVLALGMAYYPSLIMSGRIESRFQGYVGQSAAFSIISLAVLIIAAVLLDVAERRSRSAGHAL